MVSVASGVNSVVRMDKANKLKLRGVSVMNCLAYRTGR